MMREHFWKAGGAASLVTVTLLGAGVVAAACSNSDGNGGDAGADGDRNPDGSTTTVSLACAPGITACLDEKTAAKCKADGTAFEVSFCPSGTECEDGACRGLFEVGFSACQGTTQVRTSTDGNTLTVSNCPVGTLCVATNPRATRAECKPAECTDPNSTRCGNPADPNADQTKVLTTCQATFDGFKLVATACPDPTSCDPLGGTAGVATAACRADCTPNATRCAGNAVQTCGPDGKWGAAATPCDAVAGRACITLTTNYSRAVCGDPICNGTTRGACDAQGKFHPCTSEGLLGAGQDCPANTYCPHSGATPAPQAGSCTWDCKAGEQACVGGAYATGYQECSSKGTFANTVACQGGAACIQLIGTVGERKIKCGAECVPGAKSCATTDGGTAVITCNADGTWGEPAACPAGACVAGSGGPSCQVQCIPGTPVCPTDGSATVKTCTAEGTIPAGAGTACAVATSCRIDRGVHLGCVDCVGPSRGTAAEQRCQPGVDGGASVAVETCGADDKWQAAVSCTGGKTCTTTGLTCGYVNFGGTWGTFIATESNWKDRGYSCTTTPFGSYGAPTTCGATTDCCSSWCGNATLPTPVCL